MRSLMLANKSTTSFDFTEIFLYICNKPIPVSFPFSIIHFNQLFNLCKHKKVRLAVVFENGKKTNIISIVFADSDIYLYLIYEKVEIPSGV